MKPKVHELHKKSIMSVRKKRITLMAAIATIMLTVGAATSASAQYRGHGYIAGPRVFAPRIYAPHVFIPGPRVFVPRPFIPAPPVVYGYGYPHYYGRPVYHPIYRERAYGGWRGGRRW
jgi:hypothetical protein